MLQRMGTEGCHVGKGGCLPSMLRRMGREGCHMGKGGCLPSTLQHMGREGCHAGKGNEKKIAGAFGATMCMARSY